MTDVGHIDLMDAEVQEDWFPHHRVLRERAPVWRIPSTGEYFLSRYDDVIYVLRHPELFPWRGVARDVEIGGVLIPKGATVHIRYGAANRDPAMFAEPDELDLSRSNAARDPAFVAGEHRCPGEGISKLEQRIAAELFLRRISNLRFTPGRNDLTHFRGFWLRALKELHVSFDPIGL